MGPYEMENKAKLRTFSPRYSEVSNTYDVQFKRLNEAKYNVRIPPLLYQSMGKSVLQKYYSIILSSEKLRTQCNKGFTQKQK